MNSQLLTPRAGLAFKMSKLVLHLLLWRHHLHESWSPILFQRVRNTRGSHRSIASLCTYLKKNYDVKSWLFWPNDVPLWHSFFLLAQRLVFWSSSARYIQECTPTFTLLPPLWSSFDAGRNQNYLCWWTKLHFPWSTLKFHFGGLFDLARWFQYCL